MGVNSIPHQKILIALCLSLLIHGVVAFYANLKPFSFDASLTKQYPQFTALRMRLTTPKSNLRVEPTVKNVPSKPIKPISRITKQQVKKTAVEKPPLKRVVKPSKPIHRKVAPAITMVDKNSDTSAMQSSPANKPISTPNIETFETSPAIQTQPQIPEYVNNPKPLYPLAAKRRGMQGQVLLEVTVDTAGTASKVIVKQSSGFRILDKAAVKAVASWKFVPAMNNATPIEAVVEIPIRFELTQG
jgi:protein TonB